MIYSCEEHVNIALDDIVDKYQTYPVLSQLPVDNSDAGCEYCEKQAVYMDNFCGYLVCKLFVI